MTDDDLEPIDLSPVDPTAETETRQVQPRRSRPRGRIVLLALLLVAAVTAGAIAAARHDRVHRPETIVLPTGPTGPTGDASTIAPPSTDRAPVLPLPNAQFVAQMRLVSPGAGWALNGLALYGTTDDGAHWSNITTPGTFDPVAKITALDFLDARYGWAAVLGLDAQPLTLYRTANGGRSWRAMPPNVCMPTTRLTAAPCGAAVSISFVDRKRGWMLLTADDATGTLIATVDGGTTWHRVATTPFGGRVQFADRNVGWAESGEGTVDRNGTPIKPDSVMYHSRNGGTTWQHVPLPPGESYGRSARTINSPQFFGATGVVTARVTLAARPKITVFASDDAGNTWTARAGPAGTTVKAADTAHLRFSAATVSDWALLVGAHLYVTHDGGRRWTAVVPTGGPLYEIDFVSPSSAWLLALAQTCTPPADWCRNWVLFHTTDGGTTWRPISPTAGVTARRVSP